MKVTTVGDDGIAQEETLSLAAFFGIAPDDRDIAGVCRYVHEHHSDVVKPTFSLVRKRGRGAVPLGELRGVKQILSPNQLGRYVLEFAMPPELATRLERLCRRANRRPKRNSVGGKRY